MLYVVYILHIDAEDYLFCLQMKSPCSIYTTRRFQVSINAYLQEIFKYWEDSGKNVFTPTDISVLYEDLKNKRKLLVKTTLSAFIDILLDEFEIQVVNLRFPSRIEKRFCLKGYSKYELAMSLRRNGYLSHESAAFLHGCIDIEPSNIYLNYEQTPKPPSKGILTQESIDFAFANKPRKTNNKATIDKIEIYLLNGKHTNHLGVVNISVFPNKKLRLTSIERTLIDIAVRPVYAGGVKSALSIYKKASNLLSINTITKMLRQLKYVYPYHQAIGFYLDKTGQYSSKELSPLCNMGLDFDFYLSNCISSKEYSSKWRIYYPTDLEKP